MREPTQHSVVVVVAAADGAPAGKRPFTVDKGAAARFIFGGLGVTNKQRSNFGAIAAECATG